MNIDELLDALYHEPDLDKRKYIPDKLAKLGDWQSTIPLGELIIDAEQPTIMKNEAVESLGKQGDPRAIPFLIEVLTHPDDDIRRTAVWSLGQIGVPDTLEPVFSMVNDPSDEVRRWVAKSAGRIRSDEVISALQSYYDLITPSDERVMADIIRALSSQVERIPKTRYFYWVEQAHLLLKEDIRNYVKQAVMLFLNHLYAHGVEPQVSSLEILFNQLPPEDPLVRPLIVEAMGYAEQIDFLLDQGTTHAIRALGIAGQADLLQKILANDPTDDQIIAALEGYTYTSATPDLEHYYTHQNLTVRTQAYQIHAMRGYPIDRINTAFEDGEARYKLIEIYRYYGEAALDILEQTALEYDKVARQNSVYSLTSAEMLGQQNLHERIAEILTEVNRRDTIWHIRRDARIGLEIIQNS